MHTFSTLPAAEGFRMPAEYEPHRGCVMIWPVRPGSWLYGGRDAQPVFGAPAEFFCKMRPDAGVCGKSIVSAGKIRYTKQKTTGECNAHFFYPARRRGLPDAGGI